MRMHFIYVKPNDILYSRCITGSGKSTFAKALIAGKPWMYHRVNQDALGSRRHCEEEARRILSNGKCPIIDRVNQNPAQRRYFLVVAKEAEVPVDCVTFNFPTELCIRRCKHRSDHEILQQGQAREVVERMTREFYPPLPKRVSAEKFRDVRTVTDLESFNDVAMIYLNDNF